MIYVVQTLPDGYRMRQRHAPPSDSMMTYHTDDLIELHEHLAMDCGVDWDQVEKAILKMLQTDDWVVITQPLP